MPMVIRSSHVKLVLFIGETRPASTELIYVDGHTKKTLNAVIAQQFVVRRGGFWYLTSLGLCIFKQVRTKTEESEEETKCFPTGVIGTTAS
jgi:hypothetical protein